MKQFLKNKFCLNIFIATSVKYIQFFFRIIQQSVFSKKSFNLS